MRRLGELAMVRRVLVVFGLVALVAGSLACGGDDDDDDVATDAEVAPSTGQVDVALGDTVLGPVLVGGDGMTLYLFTSDGTGASTCTDECAALWPPLVVEDGPVAGDGVDQDLLGTVERADGTDQVTYAGQPLYGYAPDRAPGDVTGQGVAGAWFVVGADGVAVEDAPAPPASGGTPGY